MAYNHEPSATLTKAEWKTLRGVLERRGHKLLCDKLHEVENAPRRAGDLFSEEEVYSRGQDHVNTHLKNACMPFVLRRMDGAQKVEREERMLALVRKELPAHRAGP